MIKVRFVSPDGPKGVVTSGKGRFMTRLATAFKENDIVPICDMKTKADIDFHVGRKHYDTNLSAKKILRLGAAHIDKKKDYKTLNRKKKYSCHRVDGVIYQSNFSKRMCDAMLGPCVCPHTIILNGAIPWAGPAAQSPHKINFLASTRRWTKQKRLFDVIEAFLAAKVPDAGLFIAGNAPRLKIKNVYCLGMISDEKLFSLHKLCHAMIHCVWLDACPNSVAEALVNGCPVIATDQGGTVELGVQTVIPDVPWSGRPVNLDKPPKVNIGLLAEAIRKHAQERVQVDASHLQIGVIAKQYADFFRKVLNG